MNQKQIGLFIAQLRREKNLTQEQLGERVGVTNKTVSRWENGNYMPDLATLQILCAELDVSVNELLSGRRLEEEEFRQKADENLLCTMQQMKAMRRLKSVSQFFASAGVGFFMCCGNQSRHRTAYCYVDSGGFNDWSWLDFTGTLR